MGLGDIRVTAVIIVPSEVEFSLQLEVLHNTRNERTVTCQYLNQMDQINFHISMFFFARLPHIYVFSR